MILLEWVNAENMCLCRFWSCSNKFSAKSRIFAIFWECLKIGFDCFLYVYAGGSNCFVVSTSVIDFVEELWSFERAVKKFFELYMCSGLRVLPPS